MNAGPSTKSSLSVCETCFECMKDHHDEIKQNISQVTDEYNNAKQLVQTQKILIANESKKSKQQVRKKIEEDIDKAEKECEVT